MSDRFDIVNCRCLLIKESQYEIWNRLENYKCKEILLWKDPDLAGLKIILFLEFCYQLIYGLIMVLTVKPCIQFPSNSDSNKKYFRYQLSVELLYH